MNWSWTAKTMCLGQLVAWENVMELRLPLAQLGHPDGVQTSFVALWCEVDGNWTWVDLMDP